MDFAVNYYLLKFSLFQKEKDENIAGAIFTKDSDLSNKKVMNQYNSEKKLSCEKNLKIFSDKTGISLQSYINLFEEKLKEKFEFENISHFILEKRKRNSAIQEFKDINEKLDKSKKVKQKEDLLFHYQFKNRVYLFSMQEIKSLVNSGFTEQILFSEVPKNTMGFFIDELKFKEAFYFYELFNNYPLERYREDITITEKDIKEMFINMLKNKSDIYNVNMLYEVLNKNQIKIIKELFNGISLEDIKSNIDNKVDEYEILNIFKKTISDIEKTEIKNSISKISENKNIRKRI